MYNLNYTDLYKFSIDHPEEYWDEAAKDVVWSKPYTSALEDKNSLSPRWYVGGELNMSYNCLDKQVEDGYGDDVAVIHDSFYTGLVIKLTYNELLEAVELLAGVMVHKCGLVKGDRVLLYFPMIPQCLIAMLACTRIGAISTTVFGGFAAKELASRIRFFKPNLIILSNVGLEPGHVINYKERVDAAIIMSKFEPSFCLVYNRPNYEKALLKENRDLEWCMEMEKATRHTWIAVESDHPHYVIFTSGTTGEPKGIVRPTGGSVVYNKFVMKYIIGLKPKEVWWATSDFGWILGQTVSSYAPLMSRNPTIIYEGKLMGTEDSLQVIRTLNQHKVVCFLSTPTIMKTIRHFSSSSNLKQCFNYLRAIHLGGECLDISIKEWTSNMFNCPVYNCWGQTEIGEISISSGLGFKHSIKFNNEEMLGIPMPGYSFKILNRNTGKEVSTGTDGRLVLKTPITPGSMSSLYEDYERYVKTYLTRFPGYFDTMDAAIINKDGLVKIVARDDDIIHVGASRICGGAIEEACMLNENISEVVVVALEDNLKGYLPFAFLVLKINTNNSHTDILNKIVDLVLTNVGEVASFNNAVIVPNLPKTKSGKIHRNSLLKMLNGKEWKIPPTVDNPSCYSKIYKVLLDGGYKPTFYHLS